MPDGKTILSSLKSSISNAQSTTEQNVFQVDPAVVTLEDYRFPTSASFEDYRTSNFDRSGQGIRDITQDPDYVKGEWNPMVLDPRVQEAWYSNQPRESERYQ
jgi:hypothetical protein